MPLGAERSFCSSRGRKTDRPLPAPYRKFRHALGAAFVWRNPNGRLLMAGTRPAMTLALSRRARELCPQPNRARPRPPPQSTFAPEAFTTAPHLVICAAR